MKPLEGNLSEVDGAMASAVKSLNRAIVALQDLAHIVSEGCPVLPDAGDIERIAAPLRDARHLLRYGREEMRVSVRVNAKATGNRATSREADA